LRADPDSRCAAMLVNGRKIIILPFRYIYILSDSK
jgi:hypothetical protein